MGKGAVETGADMATILNTRKIGDGCIMVISNVLSYTSHTNMTNVYMKV